ncbi:hypothetical protein ACGFZB_11915 [Streptomyces cinerochromogenes]|uniref:Uncharacterized protein n=1 Tax=Streptomyces cinerochromogenes TaxID=66422 RepID=A0ABW7B1W1_9ACTN
MSKISFEELDGLTGEMLPERAVLSAFYGGGGDDGGYGDGGHGDGGNGGGGNGGGGSNIVSNPVCTSQQLQPSGLLTALLGTQGQQRDCSASVASTTF